MVSLNRARLAAREGTLYSPSFCERRGVRELLTAWFPLTRVRLLAREGTLDSSLEGEGGGVRVTMNAGSGSRLPR